MGFTFHGYDWDKHLRINYFVTHAGSVYLLDFTTLA